MSDRTNIRSRKVDTSTITNPSLVSSSTPTLANSNHSLSSQSNTALPEISLQALSNQQDTQSANEQSLEGEALKQEPMGHDISRISLRPQAKLSTSQFRDNLDRSDDFSNISLLPVQARLTESWSGNPYKQEVDRVAYEVMPMQIPESNEAVVMRALKETLFRKCAACEEEDERLLMRRTGFGIIQRDETNNLQPPANDQQTPPSPPPQDTATTNPSPEPQQAIALQQLEQQLNPETIQSALGQIDLSGLPISDNTPNPADSTTSTTNLFATPSPTASSPTQETNGNLILRQPTPPTTSSPPANTDANPPRNATAGDLLRAIMAVPEIKSGLTLLRTQASDRITQDWSRLNTGEQIGVVSTSVLIGAGVLTGVFSNPEARRFALDKLNGQVLPVPGVNWLHLELNTGGDNLMLGMHLDIGRLLPASLGFGPSSPSAIGGPPQPEPLPGQRMIQRQDDRPDTAVQGAIAQRIDAASGSGSRLDDGVQQHLEPHLGADLSNVRIHTDSEADQLSQSVNAVAFTTGQDIFFSSGSYNPTSTEGQHLIAHEVVHTVQQANGAVAGTPTAEGVSISDPSDAFEQEAEQVADQVMQTPKPEILGNQVGKASASSQDWLEPLVGSFPQNVQRQKGREADTEESLTQLLPGQVSRKTESVDQQPVQRSAKDEIVIQRSLVDDVFSYLRTGNAIADFVLGVVAGILEWIENLIRGLISLAAGLLELLAEADRGNLWASLGVIGLIVLIVLACAFPEVSVPILVGVGIVMGALQLAYHIAMLFNPLISAYEKGKHLGKALIEGLLIFVSVLEILQFAKAFRTISELTEGAGAMQKMRWIMQLRRFGSIEASLAVLDEVKDVDKAIQLIELAKNSEKALQLIRAERNIDTLLEILRIEGITVDNALSLLGKPGMTGSILKNFLRKTDGSSRMTVAELEQLLSHSKIADNVAQLQSLINHGKVQNFVQLQELLNNSKVGTSAELEGLLNSTKITTVAELQSLLSNTKITTAAELQSLLSNAKITTAAELQSLLSNAKITTVAELESLLNNTKITTAAELQSLLNNTKITTAAELEGLLNNAKITTAAELSPLLDSYAVGSLQQLLALPEITAELLNRLAQVLRQLGLESSSFSDKSLAGFANPDVLSELEAVSSLQASRQVIGVEDWMQFNAQKGLPELLDTLSELREARRLAAENPGSVVRVARETQAPIRPGTNEPMPEHDLSVETPGGAVQRTVELARIESPVSQVSDLTGGVRHAADKVVKRASEGQPIPGLHDATIDMELNVGRQPLRGNMTREILDDGTVKIIAGNGNVVRTENLFEQFTNNLSNIANNDQLSRVTLVDRQGNVVALYERVGTTWTRVR
jgi:hypothetical protein